MKHTGEGAAVQFLIEPAGDRLVKKFNAVLDELKKGKSLKDAGKIWSDFDQRFAHNVKELFFGVKKKEEGKVAKIDDNAVSKVSEKTKSTIVLSAIRVIAAAESKDRAERMVSEIQSSFNQFDDAGGNKFLFEKVKDSKIPDFLHNFSYRLFEERESFPFNLKELSSVFHFPVGISGSAQLKAAKAGGAPAPLNMGTSGILLGYNEYRSKQTPIHFDLEDRMRHLYVIGQTGTGKTTILKNMIAQDIKNGEGCCFIDPHGNDIQDILSFVPPERIQDVIYFDPAYTARPMGLNMMEYDVRYPEQKTFVANELLSIFKKLYGGVPESMGPAFEQYFRNSALLVMSHPESGNTLLEISRVMADSEFRNMKLSHCKDPIIRQFWESAEKTTGESGLQNYVPYITSKFDVFLTNDIMRPVVLQEKSSFNFREIMDKKKIFLVNLSKGRLGDINANLIGLMLVGKFQMAALSRADMYGQKMSDFFLYIDEFQNVTTDSISSILSEARKYRLSLNVAHQYIAQLQENIKQAVFGNVGSMAVFRVSQEDAEFLGRKFEPTFSASDITKLDNHNCYMSMLVDGAPVKPFNMFRKEFATGDKEMVPKLKELSYILYGRDREEVEAEVFAKYKSTT